MALRAGLVGYGQAARLLHAPTLAHAGIEIAACVTRHADRARGDLPAIDVLASIDALCARDDVDLVVVTTPDHLHVPHAAAALRAGKHIVVEKPFAPTSAEALALIELARGQRRMLTVFHNRRWDADFLTLQKLIAADALGEVTSYFSRWDRYRPAAQGDWHDTEVGGALYLLGSHLMDQALVLFGAPDSIQADVFNQRGVTAHNDGFEILMGKGRLRISLAVNLLAADAVRSCRVLGTRAAFVKAGLDPQDAHFGDRLPLSTPGFGVEAESAWGYVIAGATQARCAVPTERGDWAAFYRGVRESIETGSAPPVSAPSAARTVALLEAALEASRSGQRVNVAEYLAQLADEPGA